MIYICGDSFAVSDIAYGPCWVDILAQQASVISLAQVAATNLLIAMQVDQAIHEQADFVILLCTAVTRSEKRLDNQLVPFSYHTAGCDTTPFSDQQLQILRNYYAEFFDLDLAIYQNKITIEHTLHKLQTSGIPFIFDQGGFEHIDFGNVTTNYFSKFDRYRSKINLWNFARTRSFRPYYHIVDNDVHREVADYYWQEIKLST